MACTRVRKDQKLTSSATRPILVRSAFCQARIHMHAQAEYICINQLLNVQLMIKIGHLTYTYHNSIRVPKWQYPIAVTSFPQINLKLKEKQKHYLKASGEATLRNLNKGAPRNAQQCCILLQLHSELPLRSRSYECHSCPSPTKTT